MTERIGVPAASLSRHAGTNDLDEFLFIIAIIWSTETLTIFDGEMLSLKVYLSGICLADFLNLHLYNPHWPI